MSININDQLAYDEEQYKRLNELYGIPVGTKFEPFDAADETTKEFIDKINSMAITDEQKQNLIDKIKVVSTGEKGKKVLVLDDIGTFVDTKASMIDLAKDRMAQLSDKNIELDKQVTINTCHDVAEYGSSKKHEALNIVPVRSTPKIMRNDACTCGSGKKYKKCCIGKE